jgi:hypothetical protein
MEYFLNLVFFRAYIHGKQKDGPIVSQGSLQLTHTGVFLLHVQDLSKCYCIDENLLALGN